MNKFNPSLRILFSDGKTKEICDDSFEITTEKFLSTICRVVVLGAGGLGCEILKNLIMMGFRNIDIIDMDTVELTNLNRQLLFQTKDIGKSKAILAEQYFKDFNIDCNINGFYNKIEDFGIEFYQKYDVIICGLDSLEARRWINALAHEMLVYNEDGSVRHSSIVPIIDGGSEGLKGHARAIIPGVTSCIECNLDYFVAPLTYPICTLSGIPRRIEHCIEIAKLKLWPSLKPFGDCDFDINNSEHVTWLLSFANNIAKDNNINKILTYKETLDILSNVIPSVVTTNSVIAAICVSECFKLMTSLASSIDGYTMINLSQSFYCHSFKPEKKMDCLVCSCLVIQINVRPSKTLQEISEEISKKLSTSSTHLTISASNANSDYSLIYSSTNSSLYSMTKDNYTKSIKDLNLFDSILNITFSNFPKIIKIKIGVDSKVI